MLTASIRHTVSFAARRFCRFVSWCGHALPCWPGLVLIETKNRSDLDVLAKEGSSVYTGGYATMIQTLALTCLADHDIYVHSSLKIVRLLRNGRLPFL